jgi:GxxExxY protein
MTASRDRDARILANEQITRSIIGAFYFVYNTLGYGFVERVYCAALERELIRRGHTVAREVNIPIFFCGEIVAYQRIDMLVDDKIIVECKVVDQPAPVWERQLYNYLRATRREVGLLLYFTYKPKIRRIYHPLPSAPDPNHPQSS